MIETGEILRKNEHSSEQEHKWIVGISDLRFAGKIFVIIELTSAVNLSLTYLFR